MFRWSILAFFLKAPPAVPLYPCRSLPCMGPGDAHLRLPPNSDPLLLVSFLVGRLFCLASVLSLKHDIPVRLASRSRGWGCFLVYVGHTGGSLLPTK